MLSDHYRGPTKFGVDSSSRFPFRARTNRQTDATERPAHTGGYTADVGNDKRHYVRCQRVPYLQSKSKIGVYAKIKLHEKIDMDLRHELSTYRRSIQIN